MKSDVLVDVLARLTLFGEFVMFIIYDCIIIG